MWESASTPHADTVHADDHMNEAPQVGAHPCPTEVRGVSPAVSRHVRRVRLFRTRGEPTFKKHFQENKTPSKKIDRNCNFVEITVEIHFDAYAEGFDFPRVRRNRAARTWSGFRLEQ